MKIKEVLRIFLQKIFSDKETVDYVCGNGDALPLPLSAEEESEMLRKMEEEAEKERAKALLIQHNLRLVVYIARKFDNTGVDNDDLISIGTIGLIKAINSFKADKNIKLATYATNVLAYVIPVFAILCKVIIDIVWHIFHVKKMKESA